MQGSVVSAASSRSSRDEPHPRAPPLGVVLPKRALLGGGREFMEAVGKFDPAVSSKCAARAGVQTGQRRLAGRVYR